MAGLIEQELAARGVSQVLVILKRPPQSTGVALAHPAGTTAATSLGWSLRSLARHFVSSELSQASQLMGAAVAGRALRSSVRLGLRGARARPMIPPVARFYPHLGVVLGTVDRTGLASLRASRAVSRVVGAPQLELIRPRNAAPASLTTTHTWGIRDLKVPEVWDVGFNGKGVRVGHLDTGVDGRHPALRGALARFAEFDDFGRQVIPAPAPFDSDDHGTHTAGTIAGRPVRGRSIGVAPGARLASALVIEGGDAVARVLGGMDWIVGLGCRVLSMSLGFPGWWDDFLDITRILRERNVLPVFAVGNEGPGTSRSPGNYAEALSIGAHDRHGRVTYFSSSQRFRRSKDPVVPDIVAPGAAVISAKPGGGYQQMSGTSMATPHVAGLAALLIQAAPRMPVNELETAILESAELLDGMSAARAGRGAPNAAKALALVYTSKRKRSREGRKKQ